MKKYWFRAKKYGWGWYPATWQGWGVVAAYTVLVVITFLQVDRKSTSTSDTLYGIFLPFFMLTLLLIFISFMFGEPPHWRLGDKKKSENS